jgi:hypothetical protein
VQTDHQNALHVEFAPDVMRWLRERAEQDGVKPQTIVRERMRELAEYERAAREVT